MLPTTTPRSQVQNVTAEREGRRRSDRDGREFGSGEAKTEEASEGDGALGCGKIRRKVRENEK